MALATVPPDTIDDELLLLRDTWKQSWLPACQLWSRYTRLSEPGWCITLRDHEVHAFRDTIAAIEMPAHQILVSLWEVQRRNLGKFGLELLAHEVGHHHLVPADLHDHARMMVAARAALGELLPMAPMALNLYADLLINDRLHRRGLRMTELYRALNASNPSGSSSTWCLYMRIYELLWREHPGTLIGHQNASLEADAQLGARLIRHFASQPVQGAGPFCRLFLPWLRRDHQKGDKVPVGSQLDLTNIGKHATPPSGLSQKQPGEKRAPHPRDIPALNPKPSGDKGKPAQPGQKDGTHAGGNPVPNPRPSGDKGKPTKPDRQRGPNPRNTSVQDPKPSGGDDPSAQSGQKGGSRPRNLSASNQPPDPDVPAEQSDPDNSDGGDSSEESSDQQDSFQPDGTAGARDVREYTQILRQLGMDITDHEAAVEYYRELAQPHLIPFPTVRQPRAREPIPEDLEIWDIDMPVNTVDWASTLRQGRVIIPGVTTTRRHHNETHGDEPGPLPPDLDLYVDCSGSMPNAQLSLSMPALAGAVVALSALRAGSSVHVTLWSGDKQQLETSGFVRDERSILRVLTGHFGGMTRFPSHILRRTQSHRRPGQRLVHVLAVSDDGITTMFDKDEEGRDPLPAIRRAGDPRGGGASAILELPGGETGTRLESYVRTMLDTVGWQTYVVRNREDLAAAAAAFSRRTFGPGRR